MSRSRRWRIILTACLLLSVSLWLVREAPVTDGPVSGQMSAWLHSVVVPDFRLHEADLDQALEQFNRAIEQSNLQQRVQFARWTQQKMPSGFYLRVSAPSSPLAQGPQTVHLASIPADALLHYLSGLYGCVPVQRRNTIYLVENEGTFGPFLERRYKLAPSLLSSGTFSSPSSSYKDVELWLQQEGVVFYEGSKATLTRNNALVIRNTQEQHNLCNAIFGSPEPTLFNRIKRWCLDRWEMIRR